ncbi:hypothetical protein QAD02_000309 [Eretmocerus hayati]|uniref:Uncharacterized protein n=1 Tax=Eretmocerus hayati TaxID=131215 RepID=A0ACC2ND15_9HYME|nr:hypothetical protein QAD02_000309 [Eretmocerus hayati]
MWYCYKCKRMTHHKADQCHESRGRREEERRQPRVQPHKNKREQYPNKTQKFDRSKKLKSNRTSASRDWQRRQKNPGRSDDRESAVLLTAKPLRNLRKETSQVVEDEKTQRSPSLSAPDLDTEILSSQIAGIERRESLRKKRSKQSHPVSNNPNVEVIMPKDENDSTDRLLSNVNLDDVTQNGSLFRIKIEMDEFQEPQQQHQNILSQQQLSGKGGLPSEEPESVPTKKEVGKVTGEGQEDADMWKPLKEGELVFAPLDTEPGSPYHLHKVLGTDLRGLIVLSKGLDPVTPMNCLPEDIVTLGARNPSACLNPWSQWRNWS